MAVLFQGESSKLQISQNPGWQILAHIHTQNAHVSPCAVAWSGFCGLTQLKLFMQATNTRLLEQGCTDIPNHGKLKKMQKGNSA